MDMSLIVLFTAILLVREGAGTITCSLKKFPAVISFGDSTVDAGNNNHLITLAKSNHSPYGRDFPGERFTGRFCNGFLATDYLASMVGISSPIHGYLDPDAKGEKIVEGVSFASAASGFHDGTAKLYNVLTLAKQLELYKQYRKDLANLAGAANASRILSDAIYIISTGTNDYVNNYYENVILKVEYNRRQYRKHLLNILSNFIKDLGKLGACRVGVVSLPPMGCLPSQITLHGLGKQTCVPWLNKEAFIFNSRVQKLLNRMNGKDGMKLAYIDIFSQLLDAARFPAKYGFAEGRRGCCGMGLLEASIFCNKFCKGTCTNASKYVFWDSFHPSDRMNFLLAKSAVPTALEQLS